MIILSNILLFIKNKSIFLFSIIFSAALLFFLQFSPWTISVVNDPDTFYHLKMAELIRENGIVRDFLWTQFTTWNGGFIDHHFLFHIFLTPFTLISPLVGVKIATIAGGTGFVFIFYLILRELKIKWLWFWIPFLFLGSAGFLFRLNLGRAQNLSLVFLFLGVYLLIKGINLKRGLLLFLISFLYVWSYGGFILILIISGIFNFVEFLKTKKFNSFKPFLAAISGVLAGLIINPYFPKSLSFLKIQMFQIPFAASYVKKGMEWDSVLLDWQGFLLDNFAVLIFFVIALFFLVYPAIKRVLKGFYKRMASVLYNCQFLVITLFFLILTFKSQRFIEYFIPFAVLFVAIVFSKINFSLIKNSYFEHFKLSPNIARFFAISCFSLITSILLIVNLLLALWHLSGGWQNNGFEKAALWLKQNTPKNSIVFNMNWGNFPQLFYYNTNNYYIVGMDPTFMYDYNQELYWLWYHITVDWSVCSQEQCVSKNQNTGEIVGIIKNKFHSDYLFIEKPSNIPEKFNDQIEKVFEDRQTIVYRLL